MAKLLVHENSGVREFELLDAEIHIGRELDNTLRLPDPSISRHHCVIRKAGAGFEIQDLQSSNGVLLNGSRVQSSPLRDGDRITLGQIQLTFVAPAEPGATVAINVAQAAPMNPLGTVRMSPEQMAAIHGGGAPAPESQPTGGAPIPLAVPEPAPVAPPMPPAPPAPPAPAPAPVSQAPAPVAPTKADPGTAPGFGHFTDHGQSQIPSPLPGFIQGMLPPIPDPARYVGQAELGDRLIAGLIDIVPIIVIQVFMMIVMFVSVVAVPFLAPLIGLGVWVVQLAYIFLFMPLCITHHGATWGRKIMKIRVVPVGDHTGRLTFFKAALHQLGFFLGLINLIIIAVNNGKGLSNMAGESDTIKVDQ